MMMMFFYLTNKKFDFLVSKFKNTQSHPHMKYEVYKVMLSQFFDFLIISLH